jgi:hypothetical protein
MSVREKSCYNDFILIVDKLVLFHGSGFGAEATEYLEF